MASSSILGIHHVTAMCGNPQKNVDFYTQVLGLRLVKVTVNYDDPTAYHLYYGDKVGSPGTILTFFSYPRGHHGARGGGSFNTISLAVPEGSLDFWFKRLDKHDPEWYVNADGEKCIVFEDPDGLRLYLIENIRIPVHHWNEVVDRDHAIQGISGVSLGARTDHSKKFFGEVLALELDQEAIMQSGQHKTRVRVGHQYLDVVPTTMRTMLGSGTIHHVAFRVADLKAQAGWLGLLQSRGQNVSPVRNRNYFHSIYFREPGGALCEIATDGPGFLIDEDESNLGTTLRLPPEMMDQADAIVKMLPPLRTLPDLV